MGNQNRVLGPLTLSKLDQELSTSRTRTVTHMAGSDVSRVGPSGSPPWLLGERGLALSCRCGVSFIETSAVNIEGAACHCDSGTELIVKLR